MEKLLDFAMRISGQDYLSPILRGVTEQVDKLNEAVAKTANLREAAPTLGEIGIAATAMGGGILYALKSTLDPAMAMQGELSHVRRAIDDGAATTAHLAEVQKMANEIASKCAVGNVQLADSYYIARSIGGGCFGHSDD